MGDARNKIAAQIIKAEMMGDQAKARQLRMELNNPSTSSKRKDTRPEEDVQTNSYKPNQGNSIWDTINEPSISRESTKHSRKPKHFTQNPKVQKFLSATGSLSQMFEPARRTTSSNEIKGFLKTAGKLSREDMETKHFSEEIDDSQMILNKGRKRPHDDGDGISHRSRQEGGHSSNHDAKCFKCPDRLPRHLIVDRSRSAFIALTDAKPFLSSMSNLIISNNEHMSASSFVSASHRVQDAVESMIETLRDMWKSKGYKCIIMETHLRNKRPTRDGLISCGDHFQVQCLPIKEKHFERSRMNFKQALQDCEGEWSMNKKLISTDGRRIQSSLPKGLSYFWVCFDKLTNGFGHVIEQEAEFSQYFGLEVLSSLLDKDFNPMRLRQREDHKEQFDRCREFKILYSEFKPA